MGPPHPVTLARHAMATRFELVLHGDDPVSLRAAGEEALDEIERIENQLSLYRPTSEIARLNACAGKDWVRVSPPVFGLIQRAGRLSAQAGGAFDITIGPLVRCWGFMGAGGSAPDPPALSAARAQVGMSLVEFDEATSAIRFARPGVMLDLGALGKGYAIERASEILRDAGVTSALLHGGTSSIQALGAPPGMDAWNVAIDHPEHAQRLRASHSSSPAPPLPNSVLAIVPLRDAALSVSAVWGKSFQSEGRTFGHVLDPRSGEPVMGAMLSAVVLGSSTDADALSTALLVLGESGHDQLKPFHAGLRSLVLERIDAPPGHKPVAHGISLKGLPA